MAPQLLPATARAGKPRASSVNVVLGSKIEPWLTQTLKRINRVKRPLNNVNQHQKNLTETLSSPSAIWTLTSIMLPTPDSTSDRKGEEATTTATATAAAAVAAAAAAAAAAGARVVDYQLIHVEAYVVAVDMVMRNEVAFKLTAESIGALVRYHADVHCRNLKASMPTAYDWTERERQADRLQRDFELAINRWVWRSDATVLEGVEEDGAGELLCGKSEEVKSSILALIMRPLQPSSNSGSPPRKAAGSLSALSAATAAGSSPVWASNNSGMAMGDSGMAMAMADRSIAVADGSMVLSPRSSFSQPSYSPSGYLHSPPPAMPTTTPILPSMFVGAPHCGVSALGYSGFGPDGRYHESAATM